MDERWFLLLSYWQNNEFRHALTFPFLIGALRIPVGDKNKFGDSARAELEALVNVMRSHHANGYFHHVYRCPDLGQLVIRKVVNSPPPPFAVAISTSQTNVLPGLYVSNSVPLDKSSPFTSLVATIWNETASAIEEGNFSCRGQQFAAFNDGEIQVIRKALA